MRYNLINARKKAHLTQKELGELMGVSDRHINSLENGTSYGSVPLWERLRELFGIPIDSLLEQTERRAT